MDNNAVRLCNKQRLWKDNSQNFHQIAGNTFEMEHTWLQDPDKYWISHPCLEWLLELREFQFPWCICLVPHHISSLADNNADLNQKRLSRPLSEIENLTITTARSVFKRTTSIVPIVQFATSHFILTNWLVRTSNFRFFKGSDRINPNWSFIIFIFTDHLFQVTPHALRAAKATAKAAHPILVGATPNGIDLGFAARLAGQARIGNWAGHIVQILTTGFLLVMRTRHCLSVRTSGDPGSVNIVFEWHCRFHQVVD